MTWDVLENALTGELMLIEHGAPVPDNWLIVAETANPEYLEYLASLSGE